MARADVRRAIKEAEALPPTTPDQWIDHATAYDLRQTLAAKPNNHPVRMHSGERPWGGVDIRGREDFRDILSTLESLGVLVDWSRAEGVYDHEEQHHIAAGLVDDRRLNNQGRSVYARHSAVLAKAPDGQIVLAANRLQPSVITTKLGAAIIYLYPRSDGGPSKVDTLVAGRQFGHTMGSVTRAVLEHNAAYEPGDPRRLPLPLTSPEDQTC